MTDGAVTAPERSAFAEGESFVVDLERFQGPMDLLLHLIRKQDLDIFDIPIARITNQFLAAIEGVEEQDLDGAGEFLEMASTLVRLKAQMLLPRPEDDDEEDPRAELVRRLLEYEQIREVTAILSSAEAEHVRRFPKGYVEERPMPDPGDVPLTTTWEEVFAAALTLELPSNDEAEHHVSQRAVPMEEKIGLILETLERVSRVEFSKLVGPWGSRIHGVMTLLAGLELARRREVHMRQSHPFSDLWIYRRNGSEEPEAQETSSWT